MNISQKLSKNKSDYYNLVVDNFRQQIGQRGEDLALDFLIKKGYHILERNFRSGRYELDIIAFKDGTLHFVEVKTRKEHGLSSPEDAMSESKFRSLIKAAKAYLAINDFDYELQFDLIAIEYNGEDYQLRYLPEVMSPRW